MDSIVTRTAKLQMNNRTKESMNAIWGKAEARSCFQMSLNLLRTSYLISPSVGILLRGFATGRSFPRSDGTISPNPSPNKDPFRNYPWSENNCLRFSLYPWEMTKVISLNCRVTFMILLRASVDDEIRNSVWVNYSSTTTSWQVQSWVEYAISIKRQRYVLNILSITVNHHCWFHFGVGQGYNICATATEVQQHCHRGVANISTYS